MFSDWFHGSRLLSLVLALSNCALGCALGFYYGRFTVSSVLLSIFLMLTFLGLAVLCSFSIAYSNAYSQYRKLKLKGHITPLMVGSTSITVTRKSMAVTTLFTAVCGFAAIYCAVGSDIQSLSWFAFIVTLSVLSSVLFTSTSSYLNSSLGSFVVFVFFGLFSVSGSQMLIVYSSMGSLDIYPDSLFLSTSCGLSAVMARHLHKMKTLMEDLTLGNRNLSVVFGYRVSTVYLVGLATAILLCSSFACFKSHQYWEIFMLLCAMIPLIYEVFVVLQNEISKSVVKMRISRIMLSCICHHVMWIIVLIIDFWIYY